MKTLMISLCGILVVASTSFGATVIFDPAVAICPMNQPFVFNVSLQGPAAFSSADMNFIADAGTLSFTAGGPVAWGGTRVTANAANDITASFWMSAAGTNSGAATATVGTLTIDITGLPVGIYHIVVNGDVDGVSYMGFNTLDPEAITGVGTFLIGIPEPATMALLALGGLLVARRRHA
jgi:hypothetical protein